LEFPFFLFGIFFFSLLEFRELEFGILNIGFYIIINNKKPFKKLKFQFFEWFFYFGIGILKYLVKS